MWKSRKKWLFIVALVGAVIMGFLMTASPIGQPKLLKCGDGSGMLDMRVFYSVSEAKTTLTALDEDGISIYTVIECIDYAFIICLSYVMSSLFQFLAYRFRTPKRLQQLHWFAYGRGAFDVIENTSILMAMHLFSSQNWVLGIAMISTVLKWLFLLLYIMAVALMVVYKFLHSRKVKEYEYTKVV